MFETPLAIVVAEDDPDDRFLLQQAFRAVVAHAEIEFVENGLDLLKTLRRASLLPDLVILDLNMPLMDGRQALREIRSDPLLSGQRIIVLTTSFAKEEEIACRAQGVVDYIRKPSSFTELVDLVGAVMRVVLRPVSAPDRPAAGQRSQ